MVKQARDEQARDAANQLIGDIYLFCIKPQNNISTKILKRNIENYIQSKSSAFKAIHVRPEVHILELSKSSGYPRALCFDVAQMKKLQIYECIILCNDLSDENENFYVMAAFKIKQGFPDIIVTEYFGPDLHKSNLNKSLN